MTTEPTSKSQSAKHPAVLKLMSGAPFSQRMQQVYDTLARRAYELFESRGRQDGQDLEDWFRAESELLNAMPVEITEADDQVIVRAEVPGLSDKDIEVRVAPHRLIITGKREQIRDHEKRKAHSETSSFEVVRMLDLSQEIDPDEVIATVQNGTLEVVLPKARPGKNIPDAVKAA
jgi:HSP20 family protein